jgi:hypothetical protein
VKGIIETSDCQETHTIRLQGKALWFKETAWHAQGRSWFIGRRAGGGFFLRIRNSAFLLQQWEQH